jgi:hypothetical protein
MMSLSVLTPHETLAQLAKPKLKAVGSYALDPDDWLVVCGGFEDRALGVLENAVGTQTPFHVLLVRYQPHLAANKVDAIYSICAKAGVSVQEVDYNAQSPAGFGDTLTTMLSDCCGRIFLDVSAMSRLLIVQAMVALAARPGGFADSFVTYAQAQHYPPTRHVAEAELAKSEKDQSYDIWFLSSGVFEVTVVSELSSQAMTGEQTRLIVFPSLDAHHLIALRAELQPSRFSFIEGVPPNQENHWRQEVIAALNHLDQFGRSERYATSTLWYQETLDRLLQIYSQHALRERLMIAPTGSKMQAVAVGIFRSFVEDVQIVHPTPRGFRDPANYTRGVGQLHLLPLGPLAAVE